MEVPGMVRRREKSVILCRWWKGGEGRGGGDSLDVDV